MHRISSEGPGRAIPQSKLEGSEVTKSCASSNLFHTLMSSICALAAAHVSPPRFLLPGSSSHPGHPVNPGTSIPRSWKGLRGRPASPGLCDCCQMRDLRPGRQTAPLGDTDLQYPPSLSRKTETEGARESTHEPAGVSDR